MGLLDRLKSLLGRDDRQTRRQQGGSANVTVEHEPDTASEAAVKGTGDADDHSADGPAVAAGADTAADAGSTAQPGEQETDAEAESADPPEPETTTEAESADPPEPEASGSDEPVDSINGIGPTYAERLEAAGIGTVGDLAAADTETVAEAAEAAESRVTGWVEQAQDR